MNKEDKLILGTLAGVDLVLSPEHYEEYKDKIYFLSINVNEPDIDLELIENVKSANFSIPMYFDTDLTLYEEE